MGQALINYAKLMRLHRPIGIWLLLWPTLWALWIAGQGRPHVKILLIFIAGTVIMRSAGCVINDIADRHFDGKVARTRDRPLVTGRLTVRTALCLFFILCAMALLLVLQLNSLTIELSLIALLLAIIYPFTKRITYWPQAVLGMAFAWSVPMAFAAQLNAIPWVCSLIYLLAVLWPLMYDTLYALVDRQDDVKIGIKSTAILFGAHARLMIGILQIIILILLIVLGLILKLPWIYFGSLVVAAGLNIYQQSLLRSSDPNAAFKAFQNNQWFGAVIFLGLLLAYL